MSGLERQVMLITGAGSGIGRATALLAASRGATVIVTDVVGADNAAKEILDRGGCATAADLDVRDPAAWASVVRDATAEHGRITALANVAGVPSPAPDRAHQQSDEGWQRVIAINQSGPFYGMRAILPSMLEGGSGAIVNVASVAAVVGSPNSFAYAASKGALVAMSRQAAVDYAPSGIRVNVVCPGLIHTPILGRVDERFIQRAASATPLGRIGEPEEIAEMILHLAGSASRFVTGQVISVDGGWTAQ
jgi:NAD(P)-dependent dehydrogenase (short-subunit alcohol dehydrogenase family)